MAVENPSLAKNGSASIVKSQASRTPASLACSNIFRTSRLPLPRRRLFSVTTTERSSAVAPNFYNAAHRRVKIKRRASRSNGFALQRFSLEMGAERIDIDDEVRKFGHVSCT